MSANGFLTPAELRPITGGVSGPNPGQGCLAPGPAAAWNACSLVIHSHTGMWIGVNGPDSAYRPYDRQVYWRNYWCSRGACQNAAVPGTSNHGLGTAGDVPPSTGEQLRAYGGPFGFRVECSDAPWESWHWHWCGGWTGNDPGPYGQSGGVVHDRYPTLKKGSNKHAAIKRAQRHLHRWNIGYIRPNDDGDFGDRTRDAVIQFQKIHRLHPDGVIGKVTWRSLRHTDYLYTDERWHVNKIKFTTFHGLSDAMSDDVHDWREWCFQRARAIREVAQTHGWNGEHRGKRHAILLKISDPLNG